MKIVFLNIYPKSGMARYLLSSYALSAYLNKWWDGKKKLETVVLNFSTTASADKIVSAVCKALETDSCISFDDGPKLAGFSIYSWNAETIKQVMGRIRNEAPNIIHIMGGPEVSLSAMTALAMQGLGDYYIEGEGEVKLLRLLRHIAESDYASGHIAGPPRGVARRIYGGDKKHHLLYEQEDAKADPETLPPVYLSGGIEKRLYEGQQAYLETQRGCRNRCAYCVYHKGLSGVTHYPLSRVEKELRHLILEAGVSALRIIDAAFTSDLPRAAKIIDCISAIRTENNGVLPWIYWEFIYSSVDEDFIRKVATLKNRPRISNTESVRPKNAPQMYTDLLTDYTVINCVGVQSLNPESLKAVRRPALSLTRFERFMELVNAYNIVLKIDLILGLPYETISSYFEGISRVIPYLRHTDHVLNIHRLQMLPGSELEEQAEVFGILYSENAPHIVWETDAMPCSDMRHAARLTAVFFRIFNSPLRELFYDAYSRFATQDGVSLKTMLEILLEKAYKSLVTKTSLLCIHDDVDDDYWNDAVFWEIPSEWAAGAITSLTFK